MNGPKLVCAVCGGPTTLRNPVCGICLSGDSGPAVDRCELCERGNKPDKFGLHLTASGGYMGKCSLTHAVTPSSAE